MSAGYATSRPAVHPHVIELVRRHLGLDRKVSRALDVGCGAGLSTKPLEEIAECCIGIEPVEAMLAWTRSTAPDAHFLVGAAEAIPIAGRSIDILTAAGSLNYADFDLFFPEAARVLKERGVLVVYDFSQGREFHDSPKLADWFSQFVARYPKPPSEARAISPESLAQLDCGFELRSHEQFEIGLRLDVDFYLDYAMTETNVAFAVRQGTPEGEIRSWCGETLAAVFEGVAREVLFRGYIAYLWQGAGAA